MGNATSAGRDMRNTIQAQVIAVRLVTRSISMAGAGGARMAVRMMKHPAPAARKNPPFITMGNVTSAGRDMQNMRQVRGCAVRTAIRIIMVENAIPDRIPGTTRVAECRSLWSFLLFR
ncbi:MAG: hypothetical protein CVV32_12255 [Methanomicrobiales archaeon HGW-Methanomicrobiales-3]|nr:MAG: hypothetical protein CVV32_12255 [Methanomicrobiales archaeon HGW-Methanomicrobiales-3]